MSRADYATAVSVLAGSALIAVVLSRGFTMLADAAARSNGRATQSGDTAVGQTRVAPPSPSPAPDVLARDRELRTAEHVTDAMNGQRSEYVKACWAPKPPGTGQPVDLGGSFEWTLAFAPDGTEVGRDVRDLGNSPALFSCVKNLKLARLRIAPPQSSASVKVTLAIP